MQVKAISTKIYRQGEKFEDFLLTYVKTILKDHMILAVTSKIVSLSENQVCPYSEISKEDLVKREADHYLGKIQYDCHLTIKHGLLIPSAGIDESNSENDNYILYPKNPWESAKKIYLFLKQELNLKRFGILITDSHTLPLRRGVVGTALSYWGFQGVENQIGSKDLFGKPLKMTQINVADALAVAATFMMGEGGEGRPLALVEAPVEFTEEMPHSISIPLAEDLYGPLLEPALRNQS